MFTKGKKNRIHEINNNFVFSWQQRSYLSDVPTRSKLFILPDSFYFLL